jgi:hypothetical protein
LIFADKFKVICFSQPSNSVEIDFFVSATYFPSFDAGLDLAHCRIAYYACNLEHLWTHGGHDPEELEITMYGKLLLALSILAGLGQAGTSWNLSIGNSAISGYTGPYVNVMITLNDSTDATLVFTSDVTAPNIYLFGGNDAVGINVNATSWTIGSLAGSNSGTGFTAPTLSAPSGSKNMDGFGTFNQIISESDGYTSSMSTLSFTITNTSGSWTSASNVLTENSNLADAAAHIFVTTSPANASNMALATGYAGGNIAGGEITLTPEPLTLFLSGSGLLLFGLLRRKRRG